eukprot:484244_1
MDASLPVLSIFIFIIFHHSIHQKLKHYVTSKIDFELKNVDHVIDIMIHTIHTVWISVISLIIVLVFYGSRTDNYITIFPSLFLSSFYVTEFYVRNIRNDILVHHIVYIIMFSISLMLNKTIIFDCFNIIEFGHMFHFIPYLLYKFHYDIKQIVYKWNNIGIFGFFVIRIMLFVGVVVFTGLTNTDVFDTHPILLVCIIFGVAILLILQFWMWRDVIISRNVILRKIQQSIESKMGNSNISNKPMSKSLSLI